MPQTCSVRPVAFRSDIGELDEVRHLDVAVHLRRYLHAAAFVLEPALELPDAQKSCELLPRARLGVAGGLFVGSRLANRLGDLTGAHVVLVLAPAFVGAAACAEPGADRCARDGRARVPGKHAHQQPRCLHLPRRQSWRPRRFWNHPRWRIPPSKTVVTTTGNSRALSHCVLFLVNGVLLTKAVAQAVREAAYRTARSGKRPLAT